MLLSWLWRPVLSSVLLQPNTSLDTSARGWKASRLPLHSSEIQHLAAKLDVVPLWVHCLFCFCMSLLPVIIGANDWTASYHMTRQFWSRSFESRLLRLINCHSNPVLYVFILWSCNKAVAHPFEIRHKSLMQLLSDRTSSSIILTEKLICIKWHLSVEKDKWWVKLSTCML